VINKEKLEKYDSAYRPIRPYSKHLGGLKDDPYSEYDKHTNRGDSLYIMSTEATWRERIE
jgi:hypothetical protein